MGVAHAGLEGRPVILHQILLVDLKQQSFDENATKCAVDRTIASKS